MEDNKKKQGVNWTAILAILIIVGAVFVWFRTDALVSAPTPPMQAAEPAPQTIPLQAAPQSTQPMPLVENNINITQNNLPVVAPAKPVKGSALNPMTVDELVAWMETADVSRFDYDGRTTGIAWGAILVNGQYADLTSISGSWIGPVPVISAQKCESAGFQEKKIGTYCFRPFH